MPKVKSDNKTRFQTMANESGTPLHQLDQGSSLNPSAPSFLTTATPLPLPFTLPTAITPELQNLVRKLIKETLTENNNVELVDEEITDTSNLADLDKVPDIVRAIRDFDGNPIEYTAWRKSVERIFELYGGLRGTAKYYGILSVIRNKITGRANTALESYNTPLNWTAIKQCLNTHYADKRDISTLEYQLTSLVQGNKSIEDFYQKVYNNFSLILNNISGLGLEKNVETAIVTTYRNKALDTFIRGLNGDLPRLLAIKEPKSLPEALFLCTKLANQNFRTNYANNNQRQFIPPIPPRNPNRQNNRPSNNQTPFYPQLTHFRKQNQPIQWQNQPIPSQFQNQQIPIQFQNQQIQRQNQPIPSQFQNQQIPIQFQNQQTQWQNQPIRFPNQQQYIPQRPTAPKPQPPPEPMEIDRSMRSQMVDYVNRPMQQYISKRPNTSPAPSYQQHKQTRNFYINNNETNNINTFDINETQNSTDLNALPQEYMDTYIRQDPETNNENQGAFSDIHFLD